MKNDQDHWIIESIRDFDHFQIMFHEEHKPKVFKVWMKKDLKEYTKFLLVFCGEEFLPKDIDAHNKYWSSF